MTQKLTLSVDKEKLRKIKSYSRRHKRSISKIVSDHFDQLVEKESRSSRPSVIEELRGAFGKVPKNWDWKKEKMKILEEKYGR